MTTLTGQRIAIELSNGTWHAGIRFAERKDVATFEACNIDNADQRWYHEELPEDIEVERLCERCYPRRVADG